MDSRRNVYVVDQFNHRVQKFTSGGIYLYQWGTEGSGNEQFQYPWGVALDAQDNIYVADERNHRILKFGPNRTTSNAP